MNNNVLYMDKLMFHWINNHIQQGYNKEDNKIKDKKLSLLLRSLELPTVKSEEWRYTDISKFLPNDKLELLKKKDKKGEELLSKIISNEQRLLFAEELILLNGELSKNSFNIALSKQSASAVFLDNLSLYPFALLNLACAKEPLTFTISSKQDIPLVLYNIATSDENYGMAYSRVSFDVQGELTLLIYNCANDLAFLNSLYSFNLRDNAKVNVYLVNFDEQKGNGFLYNHILANISQDGSFHCVQVNLGESLNRSDFNISLMGEGGRCSLSGFSLGRGRSISDNFVLMHHKEVGCNSYQQFSGIYSDSSTGVFNGIIQVDKKAQETDAYQSSKNVILSDMAQAFSRPQLKIFADNVKCSHGSTTGSVSEEELFYLRSRGISKDTARRMLLYGIWQEVLGKEANQEVSTVLNSIVEKFLKRIS